MKDVMEEFLTKQINNYRKLHQPDASEWLKNVIDNEHIKHYKYKEFNDTIHVKTTQLQ